MANFFASYSSANGSGGGGGGVTTVGPLDFQPANADGASISGTTLYMQSASATFPGLVNNTTQTFSGNKTLTGTTTLDSSLNGILLATSGVVSASSLTTGQVMFPDATGYPAGDSNFFWNNTTKRLGIGTNAPGYDVEIKSAQGGTNYLALSNATGSSKFLTYVDNNTILFSKFAGNAFNNMVLNPSGVNTFTGNLTAQGSASVGDIVSFKVIPGAGQTAHLQDWDNSGGTPLAFVDVLGNATFTNFSGTSSGTNTGDVTAAAFGSTPNANGFSLSGQALSLQPADATHPGGISIADWNTFNGKLTSALTSAHIFVGNVSNVATDVAMSGDVTIGNTGVTAIGTNKVANTQLAQMGAHTFKGNNTGSTANAIDLTATQLTAELNLFSSTLQGLVPASGGGTVNFLRADGSFAAPPGATSGTVTSVALTAPAAVFSVSGSPVTSSGTLAMSITAAQAISASSIDWSTGRLFTKTLGANTTFTFTGNVSGQTIVVRLTNTASNWTVTWPSVRWQSGTPPVMTVGAVSDVYTFFYDGSNFYGSVVQNMS